MMEHVTRVEVRSYEIDGFGHLNHAVFLNHFEFARFQALESAGFPWSALVARGLAIHVVRVEVDYTREARFGQALAVRTVAEELRNSSMTLEQTTFDPDAPERVFARARVTAVWIGPDGRPVRIPDDVRAALAAP